MTIRDAFRPRSMAAALTLAGCLPALTALSAPAHAGSEGPAGPDGPAGPEVHRRATGRPASAPDHSQGGAGPFRLSGESGETPQFQARSVQICFNTWGSDLEKGYTIGVYKSTWSGRRKVWGARYYGPKNKTCSPWKPSGGQTWAQLGSLSSVTGDVWVYWT